MLVRLPAIDMLCIECTSSNPSSPSPLPNPLFPKDLSLQEHHSDAAKPTLRTKEKGYKKNKSILHTYRNTIQTLPA